MRIHNNQEKVVSNSLNTKHDRGIRRVTFGSTLVRIIFFIVAFLLVFLSGVYSGTKGHYQESLEFLSEVTKPAQEAQSSVRNKIFTLFKKIDANAEQHGALSTLETYKRQVSLIDKNALILKENRAIKRYEKSILNELQKQSKLLEIQQQSANIITSLYEGRCK